MSPLYTTQIPAVQTVAGLCFTWLYSWTNCWCLSLEGLLSTPPPKPLNLTCFPWYSLNSTLENSVKSQTEKIVVYWWNSFPFNSISEFCLFKTWIHLVRVQYWISNHVRCGQEAKEPPYYILFLSSSSQSSTCILGCKEFRWLSVWLDCFPLCSSVGCDRGFN